MGIIGIFLILGNAGFIHLYIYIYIYRERERELYHQPYDAAQIDQHRSV